MQIERITIHNFRGIREESVHVHAYTLLVGANNAGKSTIIDALRAFYEKDGFKYRHDRDWPLVQTEDNDSWVEIEFVCSDDEYASLASNYKIGDGKLIVRKYLHTDQKGAGGKSKAGCIFAKECDGGYSEDQFYGAKNVQQGKLGEVIYIPAVSKVDEHTKLSGPSALRDLLTNVLDDVVESSPAFGRLRQEFSSFANSVKSDETIDGRSLQQFEQDLSALIGGWDTSFRITIDAPQPADIIKNMMSYECIDNALMKPQVAEEFGTGFQRHFIFSLIRLAPKYVSVRSQKKAKDFAPTFTLILFEEPEAFLHPPQQEALAQSLRVLTEADERQVICSTHSAVFVSKNSGDIPSIVRLARSDGLVTARQISKSDWQDLVDANQLLNQLPSLRSDVDVDDLRPEMEAIKYFLWLNSDRSTLFFANHVLLVEGAADQAFINRLLRDGKFVGKIPGVYVLDCLGKYNIHRFMALLTKLGISHSVLYDEDEPSKKSEEVNDLISNSKSTATHAIVSIPKNLEVFLGIPACKPHKKPQHVMYQYDSGQIGSEQLTQYCELVGQCIPDSPTHVSSSSKIDSTALNLAPT